MIQRETGSLYKLNLGKIGINIFTGSIRIEDMHLYPDTTKLPSSFTNTLIETQYTVKLSRLEFKGINWLKLLLDKAFKCTSISIINPTIHANIVNGRFNPLPEKPKIDTNANPIKGLSIDFITILNPTIHFEYQKDSTILHGYTAGGNISLRHFILDLKSIDSKRDLLYSKEGNVELDTLSFSKDGNPYSFSSSNFSFSSTENSIDIHNLQLKPNISNNELYKIKGKQKEIYRLSFPRLQLHNFDWRTMMASGTLAAQKIQVDSPSLEIYFSRLYKPNKKSKVGNFPNQLLQKLPFAINVPVLHINSGHFMYTEMNEVTKQEGIILFERMTGDIKNITNIDSIISSQKYCNVSLAGLYNNSAPVSATIGLRLSDSTGHFTVDGYAKNVIAQDVNRQAKALALAEISSLQMQQLDMHIEGDEQYAKGKFTMKYTDLKMSLLKMEDGKLADEKKTLSFLANNLLLYPSNPMPNGDIRTAECYLKRDPLRGFFALIWKDIFLGVKQTTIRTNPANAIKSLQNSKTPFIKRLFAKRKKK